MPHTEGEISTHVSAKDNRKLNRPISPLLLLLPTAQPTVIGSEMGGGSGDERRRGKGRIGRRKRGEISTKLGKATLYRRCRRSVPPSVHGIIVRQHHDGCGCCGAVLLLCTTWERDGFGADMRGNRRMDGVVYVYCSTHVKLEEEAKREKKARGRGNWINPRPSSGIRKRPRGFVRRARKRREEPNSPLFLPPLAWVGWVRGGGGEERWKLMD